MGYFSELHAEGPYRTCGEADEARRYYPEEYRMAVAACAVRGDPPGPSGDDPSAPPDPDPAPGRAIARAFHRDYKGFARAQLLKSERELRRDAAAYAAYMSERLPKQPPLTTEHVMLIWRMAARYAIEAHPVRLPPRPHRLLTEADASAESYAGL